MARTTAQVFTIIGRIVIGVPYKLRVSFKKTVRKLLDASGLPWDASYFNPLRYKSRQRHPRMWISPEG